jgi:hypothetical protein
MRRGFGGGRITDTDVDAMIARVIACSLTGCVCVGRINNEVQSCHEFNFVGKESSAACSPSTNAYTDGHSEVIYSRGLQSGRSETSRSNLVPAPLSPGTVGIMATAPVLLTPL